MTEAWKEGIDEAALDKAVQAGEILPKLPLPTIPEGKVTSEETLYVKVLEEPVKVQSPKFEHGYAWFMTVEHQGAKKSAFVPKSLRFNLAKECKLHGLASPVGHHFVIGASVEDMKATENRPARKGVKLYWCQLRNRSAKADDSESEQEQAGAAAPAAPEQGDVR